MSGTLTQTTVKFDARQLALAFAYIEHKWGSLTKSQTVDDGTLVGLPYKYVVPSNEPDAAFVFDEMYYWDSYFIAQGLIATGHHELAEGMLENLLYMYRRFHIIPNASRFYFTGRSQPPLLTSFIFDIYERTEKDVNWLRERLAVAQKEYENVWVSEHTPNWRNVHKGLSRYYDINMLHDLAEAESGWDMTSRFGRKCLDYVPIDLNCLLYKYETDFAKGYELIGDEDTASIWREKAAYRANTIHEELWDEEKGFFFDLDYVHGKHSKVWSLAGFYALWSGVATTEQAHRIVENLNKFVYDGGLVTTAKPEQNHLNEFPEQWAYPNGWAPLHWLTINGLERYGYRNEAERVARKWIYTNLSYFQQFGVFREAYNVVDKYGSPQEGVYPPQLGFGWTNAVFVDLSKKFLSSEELQIV